MRLKRGPVRKPHRLGVSESITVRTRQRLCLLIVAVLQNVFRATQPTVMRRQQLALRLHDLACADQRSESRQRGANAQRQVTPTTHQLPKLRAELQLANAAAPKFDVVRRVFLGT